MLRGPGFLGLGRRIWDLALRFRVWGEIGCATVLGECLQASGKVSLSTRVFYAMPGCFDGVLGLRSSDVVLGYSNWDSIVPQQLDKFIGRGRSLPKPEPPNPEP